MNRFVSYAILFHHKYISPFAEFDPLDMIFLLSTESDASCVAWVKRKNLKWNGMGKY